MMIEGIAMGAYHYLIEEVLRELTVFVFKRVWRSVAMRSVTR